MVAALAGNRTSRHADGAGSGGWQNA